VSVNVATAAIITPHRIPLRNESFILIPFVRIVIDAHVDSGLALWRFISNPVMETWPSLRDGQGRVTRCTVGQAHVIRDSLQRWASPRDSLKKLHRYIGGFTFVPVVTFVTFLTI